MIYSAFLHSPRQSLSSPCKCERCSFSGSEVAGSLQGEFLGVFSVYTAVYKQTLHSSVVIPCLVGKYFNLQVVDKWPSTPIIPRAKKQSLTWRKGVGAIFGLYNAKLSPVRIQGCTTVVVLYGSHGR